VCAPSLYNRLVGVPRFGLSRFDSRTVETFAADVRRAETADAFALRGGEHGDMARMARDVLPRVRRALEER
jgi:hypothetical protein